MALLRDADPSRLNNNLFISICRVNFIYIHIFLNQSAKETT